MRPVEAGLKSSRWLIAIDISYIEEEVAVSSRIFRARAMRWQKRENFAAKNRHVGKKKEEEKERGSRRSKRRRTSS